MSADTDGRQLQFEAPSGAARILLVRHGESEAADPEIPFDLVDGHGDPPLHAEGRLQAERVADRLGHEPISAIYVSTLRRTAETAAPLAGRLGITPRVEADVREVFLGEWEGGAFRRHAREGHPVALRIHAEERWDVIPGAEPAESFAGRVSSALARIAAGHPDELVAVFAHGGVIGAALAHATGSRPFVFVGADNASISELVIDGPRWVLRRFNDTTHLDPGWRAPHRPA